MDIKDNIKTICKARGRTFADLANDLNVTRQTLFRQVTGNTTTDTLKRIANALKVAPFILLHPDPARAMEEADGRQDTGPRSDAREILTDRPQVPPAPVRLLCPHCNSPLLLSIRAAETGGLSSHMEPDAHTTPDARTSDSRTDEGQRNRATDKGPEEMKLFED